MPDINSFVDSVFNNANGGQGVGFSDASREEQLNSLLPTNEEEQQQQPQQAASNGRIAQSKRTVRRTIQAPSLPGFLQVNPQTGLDAVGKFIEQNFNIPLADTIDNLVGGNQKTPNQIAEERRKRRVSGQQQLSEAQAEIRNNEGTRVVGGAVRGVAEDFLNFGELAGDTLKVINPFNKFTTAAGGPYQVPDSDNPFSNKYEQAIWDLGADDVGAKTGIGKVAQGLLEFAATLVATGGLRGVAGAGEKFAAATTKLGKAGVVARTAAVEGLYGIPADFISQPGEGNLSNLIKEHAPEWYPTWLTALAVDEDDSPWEAALKTGFEGFGLGAAAGAIGAYLAGVRAARRAQAAGASKEASNQIGAKAARDKATEDVAKPFEFNETHRAKIDEIAALDSEVNLPERLNLSADAKDALKALITLPAEERSNLLQSIPARVRSRITDLPVDIEAQIYGGRAERITELPNGTQVKWRFSDNPDIRNQFSLPEQIKAYEVTWDLKEGENLGNSGVRLLSDFKRFAKEDFSPGTILANAPAGDDYAKGGPSAAQKRRGTGPARKVLDDQTRQYLLSRGEELWRQTNGEGWDELDSASKLEQAYNLLRDAGEDVELRTTGQVKTDSIRERLYRRAGFGDVDEATGYQYAVVRASADRNGRWLEPFNPKWAEGDLPSLQNKRLAEELIGRHGKFGGKEDYSRLMRGVEAAYEYRLLNDNADLTSTPAIARAEAFEVLAKRVANGIPVTWDDVAEIIPEYFAPGTRQVLDDFNPGVYDAVKNLNPDPRAEDGFSINPFTGEAPSGGTMVAIDGKSLSLGEGIGEEDIAKFIEENYEVLSREDVFLGGWISKETGKPVIELSRQIPVLTEADLLGRAFDQEGIFNLDKFEYIPTFGKDELKHTRGEGIISPAQRRVSHSTIDSTTAAAQRLRAQDSGTPVRGGQGFTLTRRQLELMSNATSEQVGELLRQAVRENPVDMEDLTSISGKTEAEIAAEGAQAMQEILDASGTIDFTKIPMQSVGNDELLTQAGIVAVRGVIQELGTRLFNSSYNIMRLGDSNMDAFPQVQEMVDNLKVLLRIHKESANTYSRMLHTYSIKVPTLGIEIPNPLKPPSVEELAQSIRDSDKVLDNLVNSLKEGDPKSQREAMRLAGALMLAGGDPSKITWMGKHLTSILGGTALKLMYNSMLSGPKTQLVNASSNAINALYRPIAAATGGGAREKRMAVASFYSFQQTLGESFKMAWRVLQNGGNAINDGAKILERNAELEATLKLLHEAADKSDDIGFKAGVGFVDMLKGVAEFPLFSWPSTLLTSSDEFFKTMVARMEFHSQTMGKAIDEAANSTEPLQDIFKRLIEENAGKSFGESGEILDPSLLNVAKEVTFQTELEGVAKSFGSFVNEVPVLRIFFPFVKTGHNIMVYAGTHVPYLGSKLAEYKAVMAGDDAYAKAVMKGRQAYGTMLVLGAGLLASQGMITGNGPADPQERKTWLAVNPPRSLKIGTYVDKDGNTKTKWLDYSRIEPFGQILSAAADIAYMFNAGRLSEDRAKYLAGYLTYAIAMNLTNKSYYQGIVPLGQILTPGWQGLNTLAKLPAETANNFLPLSGLRRTFANALTPYMQEFNSTFDRLLYQATAGLAPVGATSYDFLSGEPIKATSGGFNALLPLNSYERKKDVVRDALEDIEFDSSDIVKTITGVKLDAKHISRMQQIMGQSGLHKDLKKWVTDPEFKPAVEDFVSRLRSGERINKKNEFWYREIVRKIESSRDAAIQQLRSEFPELNGQVLEESRIRTEQRRAGSALTPPDDFEHLVKMPN